MGQNKKSAFTEEELLEIKQENQHEELVLLLREAIDASKDDEKIKKIANAIQNNAGQIGRFVEAFKNIEIKIPEPIVNVAGANVNVNQDEVVKEIKLMKNSFDELKKAAELLSKNVFDLNETNKK